MKDGQTDRQTEFSSLYRVCITCSAITMELENRSFQYGKYQFRTIASFACMPYLEAGRGRYQLSVSCVLSSLSQKYCHSALQLSVTKWMRFECSSKLSKCNVRLSPLGWQTVPYARSSSRALEDNIRGNQRTFLVYKFRYTRDCCKYFSLME